MEDTRRPIIATLRGPSAVEMARMLDDATKAEGPLIKVFDEPSLLIGGMVQGELDFAVLPTAMIPLLHTRGIGYSAVATIIWGGLYVCGTDRTITGIGDLKGRTISVMGKSSPPEVMLRKLLSGAGLEPDRDVVFDYGFPTHRMLSEAAEQGLTELCILSEPFVSQALEKNPRLHILLGLCEEWRKAYGSLPPVTAFLCKDSLAAGSPDTVMEVLAMLKRSCEWVKANPRQAAELVVRMGIFDNTDVVEASIPRSGFDVVEIITNNR